MYFVLLYVLTQTYFCVTAKPTNNVAHILNHGNFTLLPKNCGFIESDLKIINGQKTGITEFPWMARLLYSTAQGPKFECGGTIINENHILTAAHCLREHGTKLIGVRVGDHNFDTPEDCEVYEDGEKLCVPLPQNLEIEEITPHSEFNFQKHMNDIGLVKVSTIDTTRVNARPVCLPVETISSQKLTRKYGIVTGWGNTEYGQQSPDLLRASLPIVSLEDCQKAYSDFSIITPQQICAGGHSKSDSCVGDSGGPLHISTRLYGDIRMVQQGIVSYGHGEGCGTSELPGVYTNVAPYLHWILDNFK